MKKMSKLTKILLITTATTLVVAGGFLGLFLSGTSVFGLSALIVADLSIVGMATTLAVGTFTAIRAVVRLSGKFGNKQKEFAAFNKMDTLQNTDERQQVSQKTLLKNAVKYANVRLKHIKLNTLPVTGRRFFFNGSDQQNIYRNHLEALNFAKSVYQTAGKTRKVRKVEKEIKKYETKLAKLEEDITPFNLKYNWTRTVQDPVSNAYIKDHRTEIACSKSSTLLAFQQIAKSAEINKSYGNAVRLNYNAESGFLRPYACLNDQSKMENVELLLCKEALKVCTENEKGMSIFPIEVERIELETSKRSIQRIHSVDALEKYILTLEKVTNPEITTKFTKRKYLTRGYVFEKEDKKQKPREQEIEHEREAQ